MNHRRILSLVLTLVTIASLFSFPVASAEAGAWSGEAVRPLGEGTKDSPFLISSPENLAWVSYMTRNYVELNSLLGTSYSSHNVFEGAYFVQTADLDFGGRLFSPIGSIQSSADVLRYAFAGRYDGRHYKIANLKIQSDTSPRAFTYGALMAPSEAYRPCGIFGVLADRASISNITACNVKVGRVDRTTMKKEDLYTNPVAGVIVGTTWGSVTISGCVTDSDCEAYGYIAAGGILGLAHGSAEITQCINGATVSASEACGGIVGYGSNTDVSYCINRGKVQSYSLTPWAAAGGIMGALLANSENTANSIGNCINAGDAEVSSVGFQPEESGPNRVAIGGIMGNDNSYPGANLSYSDCYNLQSHFSSVFLDNENLHNTSILTACGGITGYSKDSGTVKSVRKYETCFSVACDYVNDIAGQKTTYTCNYNPLANNHAGELNSEPYAGLISATLSSSQIRNGVGDPATAFATCQYGISAEQATQKEAYQSILAIAESFEAYASAPKYAGVQETHDRGQGYALRFLATVSHTDFHQTGMEIVATYANGQTETLRLVADRYFDTVVGTRDGVTLPRSATSLGGKKILALTHSVDLETCGAAIYRVTPFFVSEEGGETAYGRTWTVSYTADGSFADQRIEALARVGDTTSLYSIVYPADSPNAPVYAAVTLQYHVFTSCGIQLPLTTQKSVYEDDYEIVIVEDASMEDGAYKTEVVGNRMLVTAGDMFGFVGAATALTETVFPTGFIQLSDACNTHGTYEREMLTQKAGSMRVIFQNAWFRDNGRFEGGRFDSATGYDYQLALVMAYRPDVIGLNEFWDGWRGSGFVEAMAENGYVEVQPKYGGTGNYVVLGNPLFYNSETTEYIEGSARHISYGSYQVADTNGNNIQEAILRTEGIFAGRYYDNTDKTDSTALVATFRDKATQQLYSVCCTHMESNTFVDPQIAPLGNPLRWEQAEKLITFLDTYQEEYGTTIILGGDLNSQDSYSPGNYSANGQTIRFDGSELFSYYDGQKIPYLRSSCDMFRDHGFLNCRNDTTNTTYTLSYHAYPIWSNELRAYVAYDANLTNDPARDRYHSSIDHIYALEASDGVLETLVYRNLSFEFIFCSSDHKPVMIDFNLSE